MEGVEIIDALFFFARLDFKLADLQFTCPLCI